MKAMILAAGFGTRLRPVTNNYAKPAVPFLNVPLLYYPISLLARAGADEFVINSHYLPEQIETLAARASGLKSRPVVKHETGAPLGSGGGIWNARHELKDSTFWVANGDEVILPRDPEIFKKTLDRHHSAKAIATIVVMEHAGVGTQFGGVWATPAGAVKGFGKSSAEFSGTRGYHYIGIQLMDPKIFEYMPEGESNILYDVLKLAIASGENVQVIIGDFTWFETGNPLDFLAAHETCIQLLRDPLAANGSDREFLINTLNHHSSLVQNGEVQWNERFIKANVLSAANAQIAANAQLQGWVTVGENVVIEDGARVIDSVLLRGAHVASGSVIESQIVLP